LFFFSYILNSANNLKIETKAREEDRITCPGKTLYTWLKEQKARECSEGMGN
jgi:hypothetical protein